MAGLARGSVVAVIGSGAMGSGIAQVAAASGHVVRIFDTRPDASAKAIAGIGKRYAKLVDKGRMGAAEAQLARARLQSVDALAQLKDAALVVEAIVGNLDAKRQRFADQCGEDACQAAVGLFQAAGFAVTRLDDVPGMAVMRTVAMLANEAADAVNQGVCSAIAVDIAMQKGVNYPRAPLAWADSIGIGHVVTVLNHLVLAYGEDRYRVLPLLRRKLAANPTGARCHA